MIHLGRLWFKNIFKNMASFCDNSSIESLKINKPVVVCGAGESLELSINLLKKNREKFFLMAVDTAISTLLSNDLRPDLVVVLESQHANIFDFYYRDAFNLPVALDLTSSPEIVQKFKGEKFFFITDFASTSFLRCLDASKLLPLKIPALGSVGISAIYLASVLSCSYVFYTGIDFSFLPDKYHAKGSPSHIFMLYRINRTVSNGFFFSAWNDKAYRTRDRLGRSVYTDLIMSSYASTLNRLLSKKGNVFNIGKLGLQTGTGIERDEFEDLLLKSSKDNDYALIKKDIYCAKKKDILIFLDTQLRLIEEATMLVVDYLNGNMSPDLEIDMLNSLNIIDFTWQFFPDTGNFPDKSLSFLKRFLYSAAWFKEYIKQSKNLFFSENEPSVDGLK